MYREQRCQYNPGMKTTPQFILRRGPSGPQGSFGCLSDPCGNVVCWIAELPERGNRPNRSRIPAGFYPVHYLLRSASGRYRDMYWLADVPHRSGILVHPGNFVGDCELGWRTDSWGCLLPALRLGLLAGQRAGLASRAALARLHQKTKRQNFQLEIRE